MFLPYAFMQQFKIMGSFESFNNIVAEKFANEPDFEFVTLENSFKI